MTKTAAILSFRLGGADGVSIESSKWAGLLTSLGWAVRTVAGSGPVDIVVNGLDFNDDTKPEASLIDRATRGCDVVIVENLLSLPLKLSASRVVAAALAGRPAILRHFDLAWQRDRFAHITELPPVDPSWRHVVINELSRRQLQDRGIAATLIPLGFSAVTTGRRSDMRSALGLVPNDVLQLQPTRAIERKGLPDAVALAGALGAVLWITGPAEEGYEPTLAELLARAPGRVIRGWPPGDWTMDDAYAACDLVSFPSHWEGFGLPMIETAQHRKLLVARTYPVATDFVRAGLRWVDVDSPAAVTDVQAFLRMPDSGWLDHNAMVAARAFGVDGARSRFAALLEECLR